MLDDRAEREHREKGERADDEHDADEQDGEDRRRSSGRCRCEGGATFFRAMLPAIASTGTMIGEAPEEHRERERVVIQIGVPLRPAKALPLFPAAEVKA